MLQAGLRGRLEALLASPLPLLIVSGAVATFLACGLAIRHWRRKSKTEQKVKTAPTPREQRLRNIVVTHQLALAANQSAFLLLNTQHWQGSDPVSEEAEGSYDVPDVVSREISVFSVLEVQSNLLLQENEQDAGLWWSLLDAYGHVPKGVVLTISAAQLLEDNEEQGVATALALRMRLAELAQRWGEGLPLQIVLVGCNVVDGFSSMRQRQDIAVLHFTSGGNMRTLGGLCQQMQALFVSQDMGLFEHIEKQTDRRERCQVYTFPGNWTLLGLKMHAFLTLLLTASPDQRQCELQSLRFCGETGGVTIYQARLQAMNSTQRNGAVRRWFRRGTVTFRFPYGLFFCLLLIAAVGGSLAYFHSERQHLERITDYLTRLEQWDLPANPGPELVAGLNIAKQLWDESSSHKISFTRDLIDDTRQLYLHLLNNGLLPDSRHRLEQALLQAKTDEQAARLLGLYLGLNGGVPLSLVEQALDWFRESWRNDLLIGLDTLQRRQLADHLRVLLTTSHAEEVRLNQVLIQQVRERLSAQSLPERLLRRLHAEEARPPTSGLAKGTDIDFFFQRQDGGRVTSGMTGRYSRWGYRHLEQRISQVLPNVLAEDYWVMGEVPEQVTPMLVNAVRQAYFKRYVRYWDTFLADLSLVLPPTGGNWIPWLKQLAQADSALFSLLTAVSEEIRPTRVDGTGTESEPLEEDLVSRHFFTLHSALDKDVYREELQMALIAAAQEIPLAGEDSSTGAERQNKLADIVERSPRQIQPLLEGLLDANRAHRQQKQQMALNQLWQTTAGGRCEVAVHQRYPFDQQAAEEVSLVDFNWLFSSGGALDRFQEQAGENIPNNAVFTRREQIQQFFFLNQKHAALDFSVRPVSLHHNIAYFTLTDGVETLRYGHGPIQSVEFHWPPQSAARVLRAQITLHSGETREVEIAGQWAWFRLFELATEQNDVGEKLLRLDFSGNPVALGITLPQSKTPPEELLRDLLCPNEVVFI
jgi:type VI secretion system protein ImpL